MFNLRPFTAGDIDVLLAEPLNQPHAGIWRGNNFPQIAESLGSVTGEVNGEVMFCGGLMVYWPGRAHIWTMFSEKSRECFVPVFRGIKKYLNEQLEIHRRIEVSIPCDFAVGRRRAEMLGFRLECGFAESFLTDGTDCAIYSLVKKGKKGAGN